jgi:hypothetical protein
LHGLFAGDIPVRMIIGQLWQFDGHD